MKYLLEIPQDTWDGFKKKCRENKLSMKQVILTLIGSFITDTKEMTIKFK